MKPQWCCHVCGMEHGNKVPIMPTWHKGICDLCGGEKPVTQLRDFGIREVKGERVPGRRLDG